MEPLEQYFYLIGLWGAAEGVAAREVAWRNLITYLAKNPAVYRAAYSYMTKEGIAEVEGMIARIMVAKGARKAIGRIAGRMAIRTYLARVVVTFGETPKIPIPQAQMALTLAIALATLGPAVAEGASVSRKYPQFEAYRAAYLEMAAKRMSLATTYVPAVPQPMDFEEWLQANP